MLEKLDQIEWGQMQHAYGSAEGIPNILRGIQQSTSIKKSENLLHELQNLINHQGDVYEVTVQCIPFLIELLLNEEIIGRRRIVELLEFIICRDYYSHLTEYFCRVILPHRLDMVKQYITDPLQDYYSTDSNIVERAYNTIKQHYFDYLRLLNSDDQALRSEIGFFIGYFYEHREQSYQILYDAILNEYDSKLKASYLNSIFVLVDTYHPFQNLSHKETFFKILKDISESNETRIQALNVYLFITQEITQNVSDEIIQGLLHPQWNVTVVNTEIIYSSGFTQGIRISKLLDYLVPTFEKYWHKNKDCQETFHTLVDTFFSKSKHHMKLDDFKQRIVVAMLLAYECFWYDNVDRTFLSSYGLPQDYNKLFSLLKLDWGEIYDQNT